MYQDKTLKCKDCGEEFIFTAGEHEFYAEKGLMNEPQRCKPCRDARKNANRAPREPREMFPAVCAECGCDTEVPFRPNNEKPVYCDACFKAMKQQ